MKNIIFSTIGLLVILGFVGASCNGNSNNSSNNNDDENVQSTSAEPTTSTTSADNAEYFSEDAKVMMFYSDYCGFWKKTVSSIKA